MKAVYLTKAGTGHSWYVGTSVRGSDRVTIDETFMATWQHLCDKFMLHFVQTTSERMARHAVDGRAFRRSPNTQRIPPTTEERTVPNTRRGSKSSRIAEYLQVFPQAALADVATTYDVTVAQVRRTLRDDRPDWGMAAVRAQRPDCIDAGTPS